ncbi:MFS transporter [Pseudomonas plecoglossicida]|uniref:MFS transporter n=1 Tax=Pseudomonas TaxID=286 RepID=UPI00240FC4D5|nr:MULTISPECIES: MFS transporter [Pseudomonas]MDH1932207.1 MFS transporter [Pseudomonas sp. GD03696]MDM1712694.1 MFS transporter [Pseudomonas sp. 165]MDQ7965990.1 MFS transporter [Pseudomonas plecoglossicida]WFG03887.1 MFS transporter [Pseudomonas putida]
MTMPSVNIREWIDSRPMTRYQWGILFLCFCIVTLDGFDAAIMGFIAPAILQEWGISKTAFGPIMAAAMVGLAVGALVSGPWSDKIGRRRVLLASVITFGTFSLLSGFAQSPMQLAALRFLTGLGLGAAMPNCTTLLSEFIPARLRGSLVTLMFMGFGLGSAMGGFVSAWMLPHWGWNSLLILGGVLPLLMLPLLWRGLPESVEFMVGKGLPSARIAKALRPLGGQFDDTCQFVTNSGSAAEQAQGRVAGLFGPSYRRITLSLWATYFMGLLVIYLLTGWLPTLIKDAGLPIERAAIITALFQVGGLVGILLVGYTMDRVSPRKVIATAYAGGALCVFAIGLLAVDSSLLGVLVLLAGFCINGAQTGLNAYAPGLYPTAFRATGVSWMLGMGRFGGIAGSMMGGALLSLGMPMNLIFAVLGIPAILAALSLLAGPRIAAPRVAVSLGH